MYIHNPSPLFFKTILISIKHLASSPDQSAPIQQGRQDGDSRQLETRMSVRKLSWLLHAFDEESPAFYFDIADHYLFYFFIVDQYLAFL